MGLEVLTPTSVYDLYWQFAAKRQDVFYDRMQHKAFPWTEDKVIQKYKFTNAYRASDRVSQYLIKNVIYSDGCYTPEDLCFRILFFKLFNKIDTWEYMQNNLGEISYASYNYEKYDQLLMQKLIKNERIYSAAYIMPSGKSFFGSDRKHQNHLRLLEYMMNTGLSKKIARTKTLQELYQALLSYPTIGHFLAFQFAIDINYSELCDFSEMSFVVAGPGAQNGIQKCFGNLKGYTYEDIIKFVADNQEQEFGKRGLKFKTLFGRRLQLIDCQNLFCETDKYARVVYPGICGTNNRKRIKQQYVNTDRGEINYFYPPKWGLNDKIIYGLQE